MSKSVFRIIPATGKLLPILLSVPHCGVAFPAELAPEYKPDMMSSPDDTDWFVDVLYDFAATNGITMIAANYSRWVIDLNRDPQSKPLYTDGRIITALCPTTDFFGNPIYRDDRKEVTAPEVARRVEQYYQPYHDELVRQLDVLHSRFGRMLLWDCHSIRRHVPTINKERFPDLILGDADETSAASDIINTAWQGLTDSSYKVNHNHPFKGGYITRQYGKPHLHRHALQLEMSKELYMDDSEKIYDSARAGKMREVLKRTLLSLAEKLLK